MRSWWYKELFRNKVISEPKPKAKSKVWRTLCITFSYLFFLYFWYCLNFGSEVLLGSLGGVRGTLGDTRKALGSAGVGFWNSFGFIFAYVWHWFRDRFFYLFISCFLLHFLYIRELSGSILMTICVYFCCFYCYKNQLTATLEFCSGTK